MQNQSKPNELAKDRQDMIDDISGCNSSSNSCSSAGSSKKREDLTSLGSDDSGGEVYKIFWEIICI